LDRDVNLEETSEPLKETATTFDLQRKARQGLPFEDLEEQIQLILKTTGTSLQEQWTSVLETSAINSSQ